MESFFSKYKVIKYKKGEILVRPDETPNAIFCLKAGLVRMYAISQNGEELVLNLYKPISFFPVAFALNNTLSPYYLEAVIATEVYKIPCPDFLGFLRKEPEVLLDLLSRIYKGLDGFFMRMEYLMAGSAGKRLIVELLIYAKRFGEKKNNNTIINLHLTEKNLASSSGITRETVSRELQKLEKKNLLSYKRGAIIIGDLKKLEEELLG